MSFTQDPYSWKYEKGIGIPNSEFSDISVKDAAGVSYEDSGFLVDYVPKPTFVKYEMDSVPVSDNGNNAIKLLPSNIWHSDIRELTELLRFRTRRIRNSASKYCWCLYAVNTNAPDVMKKSVASGKLRIESWVVTPVEYPVMKKDSSGWVVDSNNILFESVLIFVRKDGKASDKTNGRFLTSWKWIPPLAGS